MFSFLASYRSIILVIVSAVAVAAVTYSVHRTLKAREQRGYDTAVSEYRIKELAAERAARQRETELNLQISKARDEATKRNQKIDTLTRDITNTTDSMRDTISTLRRKLSTDSAEAARRQADTALSVFGDCQERYSKMAETADRHASDVKMLEEAWPK